MQKYIYEGKTFEDAKEKATPVIQKTVSDLRNKTIRYVKPVDNTVNNQNNDW